MPNAVTLKSRDAYRGGWAAAGGRIFTPTFGADGYSTEIDSADQVLLMYSDVDGQRIRARHLEYAYASYCLFTS